MKTPKLCTQLGERGGSQYIGALWIILKIARKHNITSVKCTLHIDNAGSYTKGTAPESGVGLYRHLCEDYDLKILQSTLQEEMTRNHCITIKYEWVKGHQDTNPLKTREGNSILSTEVALINIDCDKRAEKFMANPTKRFPKTNPFMPEDTGACLKINRQVNMGKIKDHNIRHKPSKPCRDKILQKFKLEKRIMTKIDWDSHGQDVPQIKP